MWWVHYLRAALFLSHFITAIFFLVQAFSGTCPYVVSVAYRSLPWKPRAPADAWVFPVYIEPVSDAPTCPPWPQDRVVPSLGGFLSRNRTTAFCLAQVPQAGWDAPEDVRSLQVGAAWNVLMLITLFEWITASYALLYMDEPRAVWDSIPCPPGLAAAPSIGTLWNLVLLVLIWFYRETLSIPDNNLLLFSALLFTTIVLQSFLARPMPAMDLLVPSSSSSTLPTAPPRSDVERGGGSAVKVGASAIPPLNVMKALMTNSTSSTSTSYLRLRNASSRRRGMPHLLGASSMQGTEGADALRRKDDDDKDDDDSENGELDLITLHDMRYAERLDESGENITARLMEYTCTAPLLLVGMFLNYTSTALTWEYQILFISMVACNGMGVPLHSAIMLMRRAPAEDQPKLLAAAWIALCASWLSFAAGITLYVYTGQHVLLGLQSQVPSWVVSLLWLVLVNYAAFGLVVTGFYVPVLTGWIPISGNEDSLWLTDAVATSLDVLSAIAKLSVAWTVYAKGALVNCDVMDTCMP